MRNLPEDEQDVTPFVAGGVPYLLALLVDGVYPVRQIAADVLFPQCYIFPFFLDLKVDVVREYWVEALLWCILAVSATRGGSCEYYGEGGGGDYPLIGSSLECCCLRVKKKARRMPGALRAADVRGRCWG